MRSSFPLCLFITPGSLLFTRRSTRWSWSGYIATRYVESSEYILTHSPRSVHALSPTAVRRSSFPLLVAEFLSFSGYSVATGTRNTYITPARPSSSSPPPLLSPRYRGLDSSTINVPRNSTYCNEVSPILFVQLNTLRVYSCLTTCTLLKSVPAADKIVLHVHSRSRRV